MISLTHRGFIELLLHDEPRLGNVLRHAQAVGIISEALPGLRRTSVGTSRERLKWLLNALESVTDWPTPVCSEDLHRLYAICLRAKAVRRALSDSALWPSVLRRLGLDVPGLPSLVERMETSGRNSYLYRLHWGDTTFVARYVDPLGREFLSRHEPRRAVHIYCAVEDLFRTCLGAQEVINTLAPSPTTSRASAGTTADEDNAPTEAVVADRTLVQLDYMDDFMPFDSFLTACGDLTIPQVADLFLSPLARLHCSSRQLGHRSQCPAPCDALAQKYVAYRPLERFPTTDHFRQWITGPNWVTRRVRTALTHSRAADSVWAAILTDLDCPAPTLLHACDRLWNESADSLATEGALTHSDYTPMNCLVDKRTNKTLLVHDFDFLAVIDPAYDLGLTVSSLLRLLVRLRRIETPKAPETVDCFLQTYEDHYLAAQAKLGLATPPTPASPGLPVGLLRRARAFAGLTIAVVAQDEATVAGSTDAPRDFDARALECLRVASGHLLRGLVRGDRLCPHNPELRKKV